MKIYYNLILLNVLFVTKIFSGQADSTHSNGKDSISASHESELSSLVADLPREIIGLAWAHFDRILALNGSLTNEQVKMVVELVQKKKLDNTHNGDDESAKSVGWFPIDGPISG